MDTSLVCCCPKCQAQLDPEGPSPGDFSICGYCAAVLEWHKSGQGVAFRLYIGVLPPEVEAVRRDVQLQYAEHARCGSA